MFLRCSKRIKNGKEHRYWNVVENRRVSGGRIVQRQVLYLGEINDSQEAAWRKSIEVFDPQSKQTQQMALFASDGDDSHDAELKDESIVQVRLSELKLRRPRQWGACWLACHLYEELQLEDFWQQRLPPSRKGTRWDWILKTLVCYRLIDPGSEWRLHRHWFENSAMGDLLGADFALVEIHKLYRTLARLVKHKEALFSHLQQRWVDLFNAKFEVLLYDLTSTYFESEPSADEEDKRKFGYSRDKRSDCVQVVIALIITPEGFPLAYEVLAGNTSDRKTLKEFLKKIETQYGKAERIWIMDRGIPTEETLELMRKSDPPVRYLVGTPKGRLSKLEEQLLPLPWAQVREGVSVKLLAREGEVYVLAQSQDRICKERAMRRRRLKALIKRLRKLQQMKLSTQDLCIKLGEAKKEAGNAYAFLHIEVSESSDDPNNQKAKATLSFRLNRQKLRVARRREGRYLLRSNLCEEDPVRLWEHYIGLTQIEEAFRNLKGDLAIRPIYHHKDPQIQAHIFVAFIAYCLHVTLRQRLRALAPGLTPRSALEKFGQMQMVDVHLPTTDHREIVLSRYTQPEADLQMLIQQLRLQLPAQPPPRITPKTDINSTAV